MISAEGVKLVAKRFSDAAKRYDRLAFIQNDIRRELVKKVNIRKGSQVLDVGCGTGVLLGELSQENRDGLNVGVDLVWGMVRRAKALGQKGRILQANGEALPFKPGTFDLIVSSSAYQWARNPGQAFVEAHRVLKKGGKFHVALFGRETLRELFESLGASSSRLRTELARMRTLSSYDDIRQGMEAVGFRDWTVLSEQRQVVFSDLWSLMMWIKSVGVNSLGSHVFLGREGLREAQRHYQAHYGKEGGISATFEVFWIDA
ncbi:MAG: methyltransferase domain-containing protein, partial [Candidatus Omnitrophica bacterium]|nr:methyltransferase domain-containing protein [Candidatus Omnitrophota bacterium]